MYYFYSLYSPLFTNRLKGVDDLLEEICSIPWFHQQRIVSKCKDDVQKALFFVRKTIQNSWGRNVLQNFLDTDLYEREGKAITILALPSPNCRATLRSRSLKTLMCSTVKIGSRSCRIFTDSPFLDGAVPLCSFSGTHRFFPQAVHSQLCIHAFQRMVLRLWMRGF